MIFAGEYMFNLTKCPVAKMSNTASGQKKFPFNLSFCNISCSFQFSFGKPNVKILQKQLLIRYLSGLETVGEVCFQEKMNQSGCTLVRRLR